VVTGVTAQVGDVVRLYYDDAPPVAEGEDLRTEAGRLYEVLAVRVQTKGKHAGRQHIAALVAAGCPPDVVIHPLHWYPRGKSHGSTQRR
jgi:hypothetical protein